MPKWSEEMLERQFSGRCVFQQVDSLAAGLAQLEEDETDLILLDLSLPDSFGIDTFRRLHDATELPIIVLTGVSDEAIAVEAVSQGAEDYLVKSDLSESTLIRSLRFALVRTKHRVLERDLERANEHLRVAGEIQQRLLPSGQMQVSGVDVAGRVYPAEFASGDYCDILPLGDDTIGLVVADVSGHGLGPSHLMLETRAYLRALSSVRIGISEMLQRMNDLLVPDSEATGLFVTMFYAEYQPATRTFQYATAGQRGYLIREDGQIEFLHSKGLPLGLSSDAIIPPTQSIQLSVGDLILLPTDGLADSLSATREVFGLERVREIVCNHRHETAQRLVEILYRESRDFCTRPSAGRRHDGDYHEDP